jgi:hypothetical protein
VGDVGGVEIEWYRWRVVEGWRSRDRSVDAMEGGECDGVILGEDQRYGQIIVVMRRARGVVGLCCWRA